MRIAMAPDARDRRSRLVTMTDTGRHVWQDLVAGSRAQRGEGDYSLLKIKRRGILPLVMGKAVARAGRGTRAEAACSMRAGAYHTTCMVLMNPDDFFPFGFALTL
jgi:hypothetical protein